MKELVHCARIVSIVILLVLCCVAHGEPHLSDFKSAKDRLTLKPGEKLVYTVRWMRMPVGTAVTHVQGMTEVDGRPVYNLLTYTKANRLISLIYKVDDRMTSQVDAETFRPLFFKKRLREGRRKKDQQFKFDWEKKEVTYYKGRGKNIRKRRTIPLEDYTQDPLSALYFLRGMDLSVGVESTLNIVTSRKCWDVAIKPLKKEQIYLRGLGEFTAFVIEPVVEFEGLFVHKNKLKIWLEEETKIPLKMIADIPIGSISLILSEVIDTSVAVTKEEPAAVPEGVGEEDPWRVGKEEETAGRKRR